MSVFAQSFLSKDVGMKTFSEATTVPQVINYLKTGDPSKAAEVEKSVEKEKSVPVNTRYHLHHSSVSISILCFTS